MACAGSIRVFGVGYCVTELTDEQVHKICSNLCEGDLATLDEGSISFADLAMWAEILPEGVSLDLAIRRILEYRDAEIARFRLSPWLLYLADCALAQEEASP